MQTSILLPQERNKEIIDKMTTEQIINDYQMTLKVMATGYWTVATHQKDLTVLKLLIDKLGVNKNQVIDPLLSCI